MTNENRAPDVPPTCTWQIECGGAQRGFTLFDTKLGRIACDEVLSGKSYPRLPLAGQVRTIVDVGANVGAATVYFALQFPVAGIWAYEPSPECFALLTANTHDLPQVRRFNVGLFDRDGQAILYRGRGDAVASSIGHSREQSAEGRTIELVSAEKALSAAGLSAIDILKLDTEGCEVAILRSLAPRLPQVGIVYVEFHSERDRLEIDRVLTPTHTLYQGTITRPYRGELCYVARQVLPASMEKDAAIRVE